MPVRITSNSGPTPTQGTYTPFGVTVVNMAVLTTFLSQWSRAGRTVTVYGRMDMQATAAGAQAIGAVSLPFDSAFTSSLRVGGTGAAWDAAISVAFAALSGPNAASFLYFATDNLLHSYSFHFSYLIE